MTTHRSYHNPPIALAILEIRHPSTGYLTRGDVISLKQALLKIAPLMKEETVTEVQFPITPNPGVQPRTSVKTNHRFLTRDKQTSITFGADFLNVETTAYTHWSDLKALAQTAIDARLSTSVVDGVERVGIRLIDEVRVPSEEEEPRWSDWVVPSLLAPEFPEESLKRVQQQFVVQYALPEPGTTLSLSYGAVNGPPAVDSGVNLVRANVPDPGFYFLIDTDAAWAPLPGNSVPEFDSEFILRTADTLHVPATALFERLITDKLRDEVLVHA
ncbi:TIGR04255 family protein [Clavibacter michiganensis subsp. phaseoli]|uniref:TIGR04255 family protein n=1 Tax=Clavibacter phaseoli TaxID=1734031 RepID=A0A8I0SAP8_9MICO|nr:TIGR04255 family protein [Clavibacter phaseoli]MBF4631376.1 TIGR04255 family protein [Clavibacter phaseoli]